MHRAQGGDEVRQSLASYLILTECHELSSMSHRALVAPALIALETRSLYFTTHALMISIFDFANLSTTVPVRACRSASSLLR